MFGVWCVVTVVVRCGVCASLQSVISRVQGLPPVAPHPNPTSILFSFLKNLSGGGGWMVWDGDGDGGWGGWVGGWVQKLWKIWVFEKYRCSGKKLGFFGKLGFHKKNSVFAKTSVFAKISVFAKNSVFTKTLGFHNKNSVSEKSRFSDKSDRSGRVWSDLAKCDFSQSGLSHPQPWLLPFLF